MEAGRFPVGDLLAELGEDGVKKRAGRELVVGVGEVHVRTRRVHEADTRTIFLPRHLTHSVAFPGYLAFSLALSPFHSLSPTKWVWRAVKSVALPRVCFELLYSGFHQSGIIQVLSPRSAQLSCMRRTQPTLTRRNGEVQPIRTGN